MIWSGSWGCLAIWKRDRIAYWLPNPVSVPFSLAPYWNFIITETGGCVDMEQIHTICLWILEMVLMSVTSIKSALHFGFFNVQSQNTRSEHIGLRPKIVPVLFKDSSRLYCMHWWNCWPSKLHKPRDANPMFLQLSNVVPMGVSFSRFEISSRHQVGLATFEITPPKKNLCARWLQGSWEKGRRGLKHRIHLSRMLHMMSCQEYNLLSGAQASWTLT